MPQPPDPNLIALWYHYEEIAMHFNSLIIQFRLQLIGGVGALGTAATYLIGGKVEDVKQRGWLRTIVAGGMLILVGAAAAIDLLYYDRLLRGAVDGLLRFEAQHPEIELSTRIEANVDWWGNHAVMMSYGAMLVVLLLFTVWSIYDYMRHRGDLTPTRRAYTFVFSSPRRRTERVGRN